MARSCLLALLFVTFIVVDRPFVSAAEPKPGEQIATSLEMTLGKGENAKEVKVRYLLFLPEGYAKQKEAWPLMLFMHGAGERGDDLNRVKVHGPPKIVQTRKDFPFVVVSPQCPKGERWNPDAMARLVDHLAGELKIDKRRMYVTGLSMGGRGTWVVTAKHPKLFAAAVPICGWGDPSKAANVTHLPIWAFHGDADRVVPLSGSQTMVDAIKKAGGKPKLTVYPGVGHDSWTATYKNKDVYKWLLSHKRPE